MTDHGPIFRPLPSASRFAAAVLLAGLAIGLLGCASDGARPAVSSSARRSVAERTSDGLELAKSTKRSVLWVKPDHHLGRYDEVIVQVAGFLYATGQAPLSPDEEKQVGEMLAATLAGITTDSPVRQTRSPGPCAVVVNVGLKDLRLHTSEESGSSTSFVSSFGSVTLVVEFRDSLTDTPLLRFMAAGGLGGGPGTGQAGANLPRLGKTLGEIATEMVDELAIIVPSTTAKQTHECKDGIYALTGRG